LRPELFRADFSGLCPHDAAAIQTPAPHSLKGRRTCWWRMAEILERPPPQNRL
jgi:hypothetical protein